jgi:4-carboxymuconolactone decarboxylase
MSRLTRIPDDEMTPEQQEEWASLLRQYTPKDDGQIGGPFDTWFRSPEMSRMMRRFGGFLWSRTSLDRGIVEFAIDIAAAFWRSSYEWNAHGPRAVEHGIPQSVMDDIAAGRPPTTDRNDILVAHEVCAALLQGRALSQPLYDRALAEFGERGLVELCGTVGFYTTVAFTLRAFDIEPAEGQPRVFAPVPEA